MKTYIVQISDEEEKALLTELDDVKLHLEIVVHNLARRAILNIIRKNTNFQPEKLSSYEREDLIRPMVLETLVDRREREHREVNG